ncbi:MAG TPA: hypothetical protein VFQ51_02260 [Vicinamibacteria bacterium]|nr:hypothetical protein [Vicinamibacteria bacterium]
MRSASAVGVGLLYLLAAGLASAQNRISNSEFHTNVSGWTPDAGDLFEWDPLDWQASPSSGSARLTADAAGQFVAARTICMPAGLLQMELFGRIRFAGGQAGQGAARIGLATFDDPGCLGVYSSDTTENIFSTTTDTWVPVSIHSTGGGVFMRVSLLLVWTGGGAVSVLFDHVIAGPVGTTPVALQSFTVE